MPRHWMLICAQLAVFLIAHVCAVWNQYGTISLLGPAFVNREVTLKATPFYPWGCDVEWICIRDGSTTLQTMTGTNVKRYSKDGSFFLKWKASIAYNKSDFYAVCPNTTIKTGITSLNLKDIVGKCGALVLLSPVVRGADVKLGYFPSDHSIKNQTYTTRTLKKNIENGEIQLHNGSYKEEKVSEYFYKLTVLNFDTEDEGTYILECNSVDSTESVHLYIQERPSNPVLGPMSPDFNITGCIYVYSGSDVYCITHNGTKPVQVVLLIGNDSFVFAESKEKKGLYPFHNVHQHMAGLPRRNVTCLVSNAALETPYEVHGILCNVEKGSPPELTVPEFLVGENSKAVCEMRNAFTAPAIEIQVGTFLLSEVQQTAAFNTSSNNITSQTKATKNSPTLNLNTTSPVALCPNNSLIVKCVMDGYKAIFQWTLRWEDENSTVLRSCNKTGECLLRLNYTGEVETTYTCKASKSEEHLRKSFAVLSSRTNGRQCQVNDIQTISSIFRFPVKNLLIGTGVFCGLCVVFAIGRCICLKRQKVNAINTVAIVEIHSDTDTSENDVIHIRTEGVQYAVVQRQPATQRIETQQPHNDDSLTYAELDINFLQEAHSSVPSRKNYTRTEYADIEFHSTQTPDVQDPVYDNASTKI